MAPSPAPATRFSMRRALVTVGICTLLIATAQRVMGLPDAALVREFATGGRPSDEAALATASLLVWGALVAGCGWLLVISCDGLPRVVARRRLPGMDQGTVVMVIGICLLVMGLAHHAAAAPQICCGSMQEAAQSLGR